MIVQQVLFDNPVTAMDQGKLSRNRAYRESVANHPKQRGRVLLAISEAGIAGATRHEIAESLGIPLASVCGRVRELVQIGLVVETGRSRITKHGKHADVLVRRELANVRFHQPKNETTMKNAINELPDGITCPNTPRDQHGDLIKPGRFYLMAVRGQPSAKVKVSEDPATGDLYYGTRGADRPQHVDQSDPNAEWILL